MDLDNELNDEQLLNSLIAFCDNYKNRIMYLKNVGRMSEFKENGVQQNLKNADRAIMLFELKKRQNGFK